MAVVRKYRLKFNCGQYACGRLVNEFPIEVISKDDALDLEEKEMIEKEINAHLLFEIEDPICFVEII